MQLHTRAQCQCRLVLQWQQMQDDVAVAQMQGCAWIPCALTLALCSFAPRHNSGSPKDVQVRDR